jgi:hypothetical protein
MYEMVTLEILSIGRKYCHCRHPGKQYDVNLIINSELLLLFDEGAVSLTPGSTVTLPCLNRSTRNPYCLTVMYEPVSAEAFAAETRRVAKIRLEQAEDDAENGLTASNRIKRALRTDTEDPYLVCRLAALQRRINENSRSLFSARRNKIK